jgi:hypothetical protein
MSKILFGYPFMVFKKCSCTNQIPIQSVELYNKSGDIALKYDLQCPVCESNLQQVISIGQNEIDLSNYINVFKVVPTLKDELCIIKLDTVNAKFQDGELKLYGSYSYLRFWDNMIQRDIIKISYKTEN